MQSWSWEGEDVLLRKLSLALFSLERGFYVDIGAHHPFDLSNTALLYSEGWRGINIDATPGTMAAFTEYRPEDVNLEIGIGAMSGPAVFSQFGDAALNGFLTPEMVEHQIRRGESLVTQTVIEMRPINEVLAAHAADRNVDLLTIDAEGRDLEILASWDFSRWRPRLICTEMLGYGFMPAIMGSETVRLLSEHGYGLFSRLHFSAIFVREDAINL